MRDFTKYQVWHDSKKVVTDVYLETKNFPSDEKFGITNQIRRARISIPSNIAEGCSRSSEKEFSRFIEISIGSCFELKTQLILATELGFCQARSLNTLLMKLDKVTFKLLALHNKLK